MIVFRDGRRSAAAPQLARALAERLHAISSDASPESLLEPLLRSGELECGLADAGSSCAARLEGLTTLLAQAMLEPRLATALSKAAAVLAHVPEVEIKVSPPEGFAYYALHPARYVEAIANVGSPGGRVLVVGLRSIGTTLSAVVTAALRLRGVEAQRITIRPAGHPFDRVTELSAEQKQVVASAIASGARLLVVDEGPGLSGSSLLSAAEALEALGASPERVTIFCAHQPDVDKLRGRDAAQRWSKFRSMAVDSGPLRPADAAHDLSYGQWRARFYADENAWPASWSSLERRKFGSSNGKTFYKFEGFGHYGSAVRERAEALAEGGFAPGARNSKHGFTAYDRLIGRPLQVSDLSGDLLERIASYLAFRAGSFVSSQSQPLDLGAMASFNHSQEFGRELSRENVELLRLLEPEHLVVADGRMLPHEWIASESGRVFKTDGASHGDDHFYPGPVDVSWDLAGTIVEWDLDRYGTEFLVGRFQAHSDVQVGRRLEAYVLAYSLFRIGYCRMAASAMRGSAEEARLNAAAERYRRQIESREELAIAA